MKVSVDTNDLVRAVVRDDRAQAKVAIKFIRDAELIAIALPPGRAPDAESQANS